MTPAPQEPTLKSITIISPIPSKGLGRVYLSRSAFLDEQNAVELGLIVRNDGGVAVRDAVVEVTATDSSQNRTYNGNTGTITPIYTNGTKSVVPYYHFTYNFRTPGEHTITFAALGLTQSVVLTAAEDTR